MARDSFERIPTPPLRLPEPPAPTIGPDAHKLVPNYALEDQAPVRSTGAGGGGTEGDPVDAVGTNGLLNTVQKHSTWAPPTLFPQALGVRDGVAEWDADLDGMRLYNAVLAKLLNINIADLTEDMQIISEDNGAGGTRLVIASGPMTPGGGGGPCPFDITVAAGTATFRAGTINQLLPSNYLTGIAIPGVGTRYIVLNCTASNGEITSAAFAADSSPPPAITPYAGQPPVSFKVLIGVTINGAAVKVWGCGNITARPEEAFRLQKVTPVAGQVPYDVYYTWDIRLT